MEERTDVVRFKGGPITLVGPELKVGDVLPEATLAALDLHPVSIAKDATGKAKLIITVPSVDTSVCSLESKKFSDHVKSLDPAKVAVFIISADLPFALGRWASAEDVDNIELLSDYREMATARGWGLYLKELGVFARAVYVADETGTVTYSEVVPEITSEPNYTAALAAVSAAADRIS